MSTSLRPLMIGTLEVAVALPVAIAEWVARALRADAVSRRLHVLTLGVPLPAYVVTAVVWVPLVATGIFYPVSDAENLKNSWGGPRSSEHGWSTSPSPWSDFSLLLFPLRSGDAGVAPPGPSHNPRTDAGDCPGIRRSVIRPVWPRSGDRRRPVGGGSCSGRHSHD